MQTWLTRTADRDLTSALASLLASDHFQAEHSSVIVHELDTLSSRLTQLQEAFPAGTIHAVAVKANPLLELLKLVVGAGAGLEIASRGELALALRAGCPPDRIVFDSPAKTESELAHALEAGVRINANSVAELQRIERLRETSSRVSASLIGLRLNPVVADADRESPTMVATLRSKFGIPAAGVAQALRDRPWVTGLHIHVGSQVATRADLVLAARRVVALAQEIPSIGWIDIGGGLPTRYSAEDAGLTPEDYVDALRVEVPDLFDYPLLTEVGRALQAGCGWAVSRVEYADEGKAIIHLGADFALREAYQPQSWFHELTVYDGQGRLKEGDLSPVDIYGPLCFSGDRLAIGRPLPPVEAGDLLVIHDIGGYTLSMWSRYCSREMPEVVGRTGGAWKTLRRRETEEDIVRFWSA